MTKRLITTRNARDISIGKRYLYGTTLSQNGDALLLNNPCIASGKALLTWYSKTHYQAQRTCPDLPLLVPGKRYSISFKADCLSSGSLYFQISFNNQQEELIERYIIRENDFSFTCPLDSHKYEISLMTAGCRTISFCNFMLFASEQDVDKTVTNVSQRVYDEAELPDDLHLIRPLLH